MNLKSSIPGCVAPKQQFLVRELMKGVVNDPQGTAYRQFRNMPFQVAGKTGTARKHLMEIM